MGRPKALMSVDGKPWWLLQHQKLNEIGVFARWVVSERVDAEMDRDTNAPTSRVIADSQAPMMASVLAGVRSLSKTAPEGVFIFPIDIPVPKKEVWADCCSGHRSASPVYEDQRGHPVYLAWGWIDHYLITHNPDPMTARLDEMIDRSICCVPTDDPDTVTNLNRPADLESWLQRNRSNT